jgi:superfamily II DNA or RNA helicase
MRLFNKRQKQELFYKANGVCQICGVFLPKHWHADHVVPYSKNGETILSNGQALCPKCNLSKSNNMSLKLREWQERFFREPFAFYTNGSKTFMLHAGVGSGKTIGAVCAANEFIKNGWNVLICSPSENVKNSWAKQFLKSGHDIDNNYKCQYDYKYNYAGASVTYHSFSFEENKQFLIRNRIVNQKTLLILDEVHHLGDNKTWGEAIKEIGEECGFVLLLTGTPTRSDNAMIPFATYENESNDGLYKLKIDFSYSYAESVKDNICCPLSFRSIDIINPNVKDGMVKDNPEQNKILNAAIKDIKVISKIYNDADNKLNDLREIKPDAAGLIVCNDIYEAEKVASLIPGCVLVTSDSENSNNIIDSFSKSDSKWIVAVKMISEGVDIPRIRVIVYLSSVSTLLFFHQVTGRGVRNRNDNELGTIDHCYFYYPNYEPLVKYAYQIEEEIRHIVEDQEEKLERVYSEKIANRTLFDDLIEVDAGDQKIVNGGEDLSEIADILAELSIQSASKLERLYVANKKAANGVLELNQKQPVVLTKSERVVNIKKEIHKLAVRVALIEKVDYNEIHKTYNKIIGVYKTSNLHDEGKLNMKYKLLQDRLKQLKNGL